MIKQMHEQPPVPTNTNEVLTETLAKHEKSAQEAGPIVRASTPLENAEAQLAKAEKISNDIRETLAAHAIATSPKTTPEKPRFYAPEDEMVSSKIAKKQGFFDKIKNVFSRNAKKAVVGAALIGGLATSTDAIAGKESKKNKKEITYVLEENMHADKVEIGSDTTKEYFVLQLADYNNFGNVLTAIRQGGFEVLPDNQADALLEELRKKNPDAIRKAGSYVMVPAKENVEAKEGEEAMGIAAKRLRTVFADRKSDLTSTGIYEIGQDEEFNATDSRYGFLVQKKKTTADFASGLTKN